MRADPCTLITVADDVQLSEERVYAAMAYLAVLVVVPLLVRRGDPYVAFHARQGLVILIGYAVALLLSSVLPRVGSLLFMLLMLASVVGLVNALIGRQWRIPLVGQAAQMFRI